MTTTHYVIFGRRNGGWEWLASFASVGDAEQALTNSAHYPLTRDYQIARVEFLL